MYHMFQCVNVHVWFPSMCHIAFGAGTEHRLRLSVRLATAHTSVPAGSTLLKESRTLVTATKQQQEQKMLNLKDKLHEILTAFQFI